MPKRRSVTAANSPLYRTPFRRRSTKLVDVLGQHLPQAGESRVFLEVGARVGQRPGDVLDVDRIAPCGGLETERAEGLQVALQGHQVEAPPVLLCLAA